MTSEGKTTLAVSGPERMHYGVALQRQLELRDRCEASDGAENFLMLLEHDPVITIGRSGSREDVVASAEKLSALGVEVVESNRGGKLTYHGPGQLVMYPIIDLRRRGRDIHRYLRDLEDCLIRLCVHWGIEAERDPSGTGVWTGGNKIAAIGIAVRRWISYHGVALNLSADLSHFDLIVPCGIRDRGVTSIARELDREVAVEEAAAAAVESFCGVFGFEDVRGPHGPFRKGGSGEVARG